MWHLAFSIVPNLISMLIHTCLLCRWRWCRKRLAKQGCSPLQGTWSHLCSMHAHRCISFFFNSFLWYMLKPDRSRQGRGSRSISEKRRLSHLSVIILDDLSCSGYHFSSLRCWAAVTLCCGIAIFHVFGKYYARFQTFLLVYTCQSGDITLCFWRSLSGIEFYWRDILYLLITSIRKLKPYIFSLNVPTTNVYFARANFTFLLAV